jgi:hypothetical protein
MRNLWSQPAFPLSAVSPNDRVKDWARSHSSFPFTGKFFDHVSETQHLYTLTRRCAYHKLYRQFNRAVATEPNETKAFLLHLNRNAG